MTRYLSICSGIEAATVAWEPLGWTPAGFAEIDTFPSAVLAHRFPDTPNFGDFTAIKDRAGFVDIARATDVLIGGTPCQSFSVAGLRGGLNDARGNLALEFVRLADAIDAVRCAAGLQPVIVIWENVPGVLSMPDNAFGCFLGALVGADAALVPGRGQRWTNAGLVAGPQRAAAWRVLDAQYFGVAQRRERVFVVAGAGGFRPDEVLFEPDGGDGNPASRRKTSPHVAQTLTGGARNRGGYSNDDGELVVINAITSKSGGADDNDARAGHLTAVAGPAVFRTSGNSGAWPVGDVAATLSTGTDACDQVVAFALRGRSGGAMPEIHGDGTTVGALRAAPGGSSNDYVCVTGGQTHALTAGVHDASEDGTGRGTPIVATGHNAVRRLTPTEKEALQGFPRGWTCVPYGRPRRIDADEVDYLRGQGADVWLDDAGHWMTSAAADGPRGKALGNSMAVPVIRWIGERISGREE